MKSFLKIALILTLASACQNSEEIVPQNFDCMDPLVSETLNHPAYQELTNAVNEAISKGFPGVNVSISNSNGGQHYENDYRDDDLSTARTITIQLG